MSRLLSSLVDGLGALWCRTLHSNPMWPVNGVYQCRTCYRKYPVAWEQQPQLPPDPQPAPARTMSTVTPSA